MTSERIKFGWLEMSRRDAKYYIGVCLLITFVMWLSGYIFLLNSRSYAFAQEYIRSNQTIRVTLGSISFIRPGFVNFKRHLESERESAQFSVVVSGEKTSGVVYMDVESSGQDWIVNEASLETEIGRINLK